MCNSISLVLWTVFLVGQVVPVVLHRIWCEQAVPAGGTGGTGIAWAHAGRTDRQSFMVVPPVPRISPTKLCRTGWSTTSTTGPTRVHDCPVSLTKSDFIE